MTRNAAWNDAHNPRLGDLAGQPVVAMPVDPTVVPVLNAAVSNPVDAVAADNAKCGKCRDCDPTWNDATHKRFDAYLGD